MFHPKSKGPKTYTEVYAVSIFKYDQIWIDNLSFPDSLEITI